MAEFRVRPGSSTTVDPRRLRRRLGAIAAEGELSVANE